jgi:hypothetical protein
MSYFPGWWAIPRPVNGVAMVACTWCQVSQEAPPPNLSYGSPRPPPEFRAEFRGDDGRDYEFRSEDGLSWDLAVVRAARQLWEPWREQA